jgi:hypothetical protein
MGVDDDIVVEFHGSIHPLFMLPDLPYGTAWVSIGSVVERQEGA